MLDTGASSLAVLLGPTRTTDHFELVGTVAVGRRGIVVRFLPSACRGSLHRRGVFANMALRMEQLFQAWAGAVICSHKYFVVCLQQSVAAD